MNLAYQSWLNDAFKLATRLHRERRFDLVHLITYVGFRFPGKFYQLNIPFVWGPIGGLENTPWRFLPSLGLRGTIEFTGRNAINSLQKRFLPGPKKAFAKAAACGGIIAATEGIRREIKQWYGHDSHVICEVGPPDRIATSIRPRIAGEPLRVAWSGLHIARKGLPFLLQAVAQLPATCAIQLDILGQGPCTRGWKAMASKLGLEDRCTWHGWMPRDKATQLMHDSHLFAITSMQDLTSTVLVEALAAGLPIVCPDHCGFSDVVNEDCGIKVPLRTPRQLESDMAKAIAQLEGDEPFRQRLAAGSLRRVQDFSWEGKSRRLEAIYQEAVRRYRPTS